MIRLCAEAGLPEPEFHSEGERFLTVVWQDWLTEAVMDKLELSDRQKAALAFVKTTGHIRNQDLRNLTGVVIRTASRDLENLVSKGVLRKVGTTGRNAHYVLAHKQDRNRTNRT